MCMLNKCCVSNPWFGQDICFLPVGPQFTGFTVLLELPGDPQDTKRVSK